MRHRFLAVSLVFAGLSLCFATGCGSGQSALAPVADSPTASPPGVPDRDISGLHACRLVPANVVAQVLGALLERPYETPDGLKCFYNTAVTGGGGPSYILTIMTRSGYEAAKSFAEGAAQSGAERFASAHDLGDDTFSVSTDSGEHDYSLWASKADIAVEVNVNDLGRGVARSHDLVAAALSRL